jgi:hypothetical protein
MAMAKVKVNLKVGMPERLEQLGRVLAALAGNPHFPAPIPPLPQAQAVLAAGQAAQAQTEAAEAALATRIQERRAALEAVDGVLTRLAAYVEAAGAGDPAKIAGSGFDQRAGPAPVGPLPPVESLAATAGDHDGTLDLSWDRVPGATGYEVYQSTDVAQPAGWTFACSCSRSGATVEGLASGTRYWFRVRAVGAAGPGPWSDPATRIAP